MSILTKFTTEGTILDGTLNGSKPKAALKDAATMSINNSFAKGQYQGALDADALRRAQDLTGNS
jgi:hypothetical protein